MRIGLLADSDSCAAGSEARVWSERLVRGLAPHEFHVFDLAADGAGRSGGAPCAVPDAEGPSVPGSAHPRPYRPSYQSARQPAYRPSYRLGRRERRSFLDHFGLLVGAAGDAVGGTDPGGADFAEGLYGLALLARDHGPLTDALRSDPAVRVIESLCRTPGARGAHGLGPTGLTDHLALAAGLAGLLAPLSLPWYEGNGLGAVDLCHAATGGPAALPGVLAKRFFGIPLLVTEYGVHLRAHYLSGAHAGADRPSAPVRALLAAARRLLAAEIYGAAALVVSGDRAGRRWQERCGTDPAKLRTVHPGLDPEPFTAVGDGGCPGDPYTVVWRGPFTPAEDLVALLHAFARVRAAEPRARLRLFGESAPDDKEAKEAAEARAHCRALAAHLFPDEAADDRTAGENPVSFEELGGPEAPGAADAYAMGRVVALTGAVDGFPTGLAEAMLCGRATVATDAGGAAEVVGGTGLVVPPRNPRALADACLTLLGDPERAHRLGAVARDRALELFTVDQNLTAFHGIYLELISRSPVRREALDDAGTPLPFAHPAEARVPLTALTSTAAPRPGFPFRQETPR
ncbi:glycosyltransferase [Streptomyces yaizuensis]|nr:glycosyltransferase [Streptomyces sp. YSPA8]